MDYLDFLQAKVPQAELRGFEPPSAPHPSLFPHQRDIAAWACRGGQRAVFAAFGLGKTRIHLQVASWVIEQGKLRVERTASPLVESSEAEPTQPSTLNPQPSRYLIVCPLGVRHVFTKEDGPAMGLDVRYCRTDAEIDACPAPIIVTNYERVRDGAVTIDGRFAGAGLDEASVLRSFGSKTYQSFLDLFAGVRYRYVFTATPSPNRHKELIHYGGFLGVMDTGNALTQFFKRDSEKAGNLTLYPHREKDFWDWLSSWAVFIQKPGDLGYDDTGYDLPPLTVHWHMVGQDHTKAWAQEDSWGQKALFLDESAGLKAVAAVKRETIGARLCKAIEIMGGEWQRHDEETEKLIDRAVQLVRIEKRATAALLQSHLKIGHRKATHVLEIMEQRQLLGSTLNTQHSTTQSELTPRDKHWILWHDLEAERELIEDMVPEAKTVYGTQDLDVREELILGFSRGDYRILATKPIIAGSGCNFQRHCADAIFLGSTYKFNDFIQAVHRIQRFQQPSPVNIHVIFAESESPVIETLKLKWRQHDALVATMTELLRANHLSLQTMKLERQLGCERMEVSGERFRAIRNDSVVELGKEQTGLTGLTGESPNLDHPQNPKNPVEKTVSAWPDNSVDCIVTSIPFGNQYEYSPSYNDFGHNEDNTAFFRQMDFLVLNLLRVLRPGRVACIHVKDRIRFGNVTGKGMATVDPFSDETTACFRRHGFEFFGRITIDTDVVRENNQTYRLGWSENAKDSTKMGVGMPEYVLLFRKLPSDTSDAYADLPVTKDKKQYTRAQWQIDAASFWRSSGDRLPDPDFLLNIPHEQIGRIWKEHSRRKGYDYTEHVEIGKALEASGYLPASFMLFPPVSLHPDVWTDIARMRTLNSDQSKRHSENHVYPLQLDIVDRLILRYTNPDEWVLDPFAGIHTVPYRAIHLGRRGAGIELSEEYWRCGVGYCEQAEAEHCMPTLLDFVEQKAVTLEPAVMSY